MATRTIVTFHPDVACDVCGRRLLRGEQPDVYIGGGQRRMVCELCAQRAAHEGWRRESAERPLSLRPARPRGPRSLLGRLRLLREEEPRARSAGAAEDRLEGPARTIGGAFFEEAPASPTAEPWERIEDEEPLMGEPLTVEAPEGAGEAWESAAGSEPAMAVRTGELSLELALETFNASEHPRRVAGVARSLGAPSVRVFAEEDRTDVVTILVVWELCWYRYEVDLDAEVPAARLVAQGMEPQELGARARTRANALAGERGELSLVDQ
ncbi:MAG TPA: hypothetical protein VGX16_03130 [Solirubrobacteraceae bacterium]|jgi:hypothetical protein|nr:hypothetical protein [Solirubrobacteraceae bacterium]